MIISSYFSSGQKSQEISGFSAGVFSLALRPRSAPRRRAVIHPVIMRCRARQPAPNGDNCITPRRRGECPRPTRRCTGCTCPSTLHQAPAPLSATGTFAHTTAARHALVAEEGTAPNGRSIDRVSRTPGCSDAWSPHPTREPLSALMQHVAQQVPGSRRGWSTTSLLSRPVSSSLGPRSGFGSHRARPRVCRHTPRAEPPTAPSSPRAPP
mmetsp:Transcript_7315/g.25778  ORF Transcript_7315/g.25778 Transcript_7315/m.25778 type:complete len:210 (-) Transcript_7315:18-647(-)